MEGGHFSILALEAGLDNESTFGTKIKVEKPEILYVVYYIDLKTFLLCLKLKFLFYTFRQAVPI